jgi:mRNA interferase MazF
LKRGDIVAVAAPGDYGKPRPAVVIQADALNQADPDSVILALMTGTLRKAPLLRLAIDPTSHNGLQKSSQVMVDKLVTVRRKRTVASVGRLTDHQLVALNRLLALAIGLA